MSDEWIGYGLFGWRRLKGSEATLPACLALVISGSCIKLDYVEEKMR